jgi:hypothetical protein
MSTSTITIISIGTLTAAKLARVTGGSTTRNTEEMRPMEIEGRPTNLAAEVRVAPGELVVRVALAALAVPVALGEPVVPVGLAALAALAEPVVPVERAVQVALAEPVVPVERAVRVALAEPVVPVELAVPVALVESESPAVLAALELALGPVVAQELVLVQVAAVALRTRSVIAAHRPGLVPAARVEDSAAAAETTREPVVAEAAKAWVAAE